MQREFLMALKITALKSVDKISSAGLHFKTWVAIAQRAHLPN